jgi:limonene-1,2-epoxide hydrolase
MTALCDRLAAALLAVRPDNPSALEGLATMYADNVHFRDPIQELDGIEAFLDMNTRLLKRMRSLTWQVHRALGDDRYAVLEWSMQATTKLHVKLDVDGTTVVHAHDGKIIDHRDYWDLGEMMASPLPFGLRMLHAVRRPLA